MRLSCSQDDWLTDGSWKKSPPAQVPLSSGVFGVGVDMAGSVPALYKGNWLFDTPPLRVTCKQSKQRQSQAAEF